MSLVALLSNPHATGNRSQLPAMRDFCARNPDIFHYEVEEVGQIAQALRTIARVQPRVLVINGGDGTVQTALTELYHGGHFAGDPPPVAVLPNGKTNLIALDLGAAGDPIAALEQIVTMARGDLTDHVVVRELIALSNGNADAKPVLGMFLGGAGLAEAMLYCRHKIYPLGLPNGISHVIAGFLSVLTYMLNLKAKFLPQRSRPMRISFVRGGELQGSFAILIVTTLEKLLLGTQTTSGGGLGSLRILAVDNRPGALVRALGQAIVGKFGKRSAEGVHLGQDDSILIEGEDGSVILDGEVFRTDAGHPIVLRSTPPVPFLKIAA